MIEACIFDLDGVIVNTAKYHYQAWKNLATHLGFEFTEEQNELLKGIGRMESLEEILSIGGISASQGDKIKYAHSKNIWYKEFLEDLDESEILPGVIDLIQNLKENNFKIALGSASKNARPVLDKLKLSDSFDAIVDGNDVTHSKPDPEVFIKAASLIGSSPEKTIVFEDALKGLEAARAGKFICCGVGGDHLLAKADFVIPSFENFSLDQLHKLVV